MCNNANYEGIPKRLKDPFLKLAPFRNEVLKEKKTFTIGYYTDIVGHTKCSPTNRRAVYEAIRLLEKQGHSVK
jgi:Asp-tRNA(Asn)/Glu-tRNA(Gln) amidotransferase A subunit family amidase